MALAAIWKRTFLKDLVNNSTVEFDFGEAVMPVMFGMTGYSLSFKDGDGHNVSTMQASASPGTGSSSVVALSLTAKMFDNGGNQADPESTYLDFTVLGWTGSNPGIVSLGTGALVASGSSYSPSSIPTTVYSSAPVLGGFMAAYSESDNQVMTVDGSATPDGNQVDLDGEMVDNRRQHVANVQLIGGAVLTGVQYPGFAIKTISGQQRSDNAVVDFSSVIPSGKSLIGCAAMLTGFTVSYSGGDAHDVNTIRIGPQGNAGIAAAGQPYVSGNSVVIVSPKATMWDGSGHNQDDSISNVSLAVIGIYA
jgi:hypothetical protein